MGGWGQKMAIFDDLQYCKSSKSQNHDDVIRQNANQLNDDPLKFTFNLEP